MDNNLINSNIDFYINELITKALNLNASDIHIEPMDKKPPEYSQQDDAGLGLVKYYILPHFLDEVYRKASEEILEKFSELDVRPISNDQAILVKDSTSKIICNSDNAKAVRDFRNEQG